MPFDPFELLWRPAPEDQNEFLESYLEEDSRLGVDGEGASVLYGYGERQEGQTDNIEYYARSQNPNLNAAFSILEGAYRPGQGAFESPVLATALVEPARELLKRPQASDLVSRAEKAFSDVWYSPLNQNREALSYHLHWQQRSLGMELERTREKRSTDLSSPVQRAWQAADSFPSSKRDARGLPKGFLSRPRVSDYQALFAQGTRLSASYFQFEQMDIISSLPEQYDIAVALPSRIFSPTPILHQPSLEQGYDYEGQAIAQARIHGGTLMAATVLDDPAHQRRIYGKIAPLSFHPKVGYVEDESGVVVSWIGTQNLTKALERNRTMENLLVFQAREHSGVSASQQRFERDVSQEIASATHTLLNLGARLGDKHDIIIPGQFEQNLPRSQYLRADGQIIYELADALHRFRQRENTQVVFSSWQFSLFTEQNAGRLMGEMKSNLLALASQQRLTVLLNAGTFDELQGVYQKHLRGTLTQAERLKYDVGLITSLMENQAFFRAPSPFHHEKSMFVFDRNTQQLEFLMTGSANISRASMLPINLQSPERQRAVRDLYRRTLGRELTDEDMEGTLETELNIFLERGRSAGEDEYLGMVTPQVMQHLNYNLHRHSHPGYIHYELADSNKVQRLQQDIEVLKQQLGSGINLEVKEKWSQPSWQSASGSRRLVGLRITVGSGTGMAGYQTSLEVTVGADGSIILPSRNQILSGSVYYNRGLFAKIVPGSPGEKILPGTSKVFTPQQTLLSILTGLGAAMNEQAMGSVITSVFRDQYIPIGSHTTARFLRAAYNARRGETLGDFLLDLAKGEYTNARQFYGRELTSDEVHSRLESLMALEQIFTSSQDNYSKFLKAAQVMNYQMTGGKVELYSDIMYYLIGQTPLKEQLDRSVRAQIRELENLVLLGAIEQNSTLYGYAQMKHRLSVIGTTVDDTLPSFGDVAAFNPLPMRATGSMGIGSNGQFLRLIGAQGYRGQATIGGMRSIAMTVSSLDEESIFFYNFPELAQSLPQLDYLTKDKLKERYQSILSILGQKEAELAADSKVFESFGGARGMYFFMLPASKLEQFMQRFKNLVGARQALQVSPQLYQDLLHGHTDNLPSEAADIYTDTFRSVMAPHSYQRFQAMVQQYNGDINAALREFRRLDSSPFTSEKGVLAPAIRRIEVVAGKHPMTDFYYLNDDPNLSHPYAFSEVMQLRIQPHQVDSKVDTVSKLEQIFTHPTLLITKAQDLPASSQLVRAFYEHFHLPANASYSTVSANLAIARGSSHDRFAFGLGQSLSVEQTAQGHLSFKLRAGLYSLQTGDDGRQMWQKVGSFTEDGRIIVADGRSKNIAGKSYYEPIFITNRAFNLRHQDAIAYYYGDLAREEDPITGRITLTKKYTVIAQPTSGIRSFDLFKGPGVFLKKKYFDQQFGEGSDVYALATTSHFKSYSFTSAHYKLKTDMAGLRALTGRQLAVLLFPIFGAKGDTSTSAYLQAASSHPGVTPLGLAALRNVAGKYRDYTADPDQARATGQTRLGLSLQGLTILLNDPQAAAAAMQQGSVRPVAELITRALTDDQAAEQLAQGYQRLLDYYSQNPLNIHAVNLGDPAIKALLAIVDTIDLQRQVLQKISSPRPGVTVGDAHIVTKNPDDPRYQAGYEFIRASEGFGTRATEQSSRTARIAANYSGDPKSAVIYMSATGKVPYAQMMQKASKLFTTLTNKIHLTHYADPQMSNMLGELEVIDPTTPGGYTTFVMRFKPAFYPDPNYRAEHEAEALSNMVSLEEQAEAAMDTLVHESIHLMQALYALQQSSTQYYLPLSLRQGQQENYALVPYLAETEHGRLELYTIFNNYHHSDWSLELEAFSFQRHHDELQEFAELYLRTPLTIQDQLLDPSSALFKKNKAKLGLIENMLQVRQEYNREWAHLTKFQTTAIANLYKSPSYTTSQAQFKYLSAQADDALRQFLRSKKGEKYVRNLALQMFGSEELVQALYQGSDSRLQKNWRVVNQIMAYAKYMSQAYHAVGSQIFQDYAAATVMLNPLTHALAYRFSNFTDVPDRADMMAGLAIMADPELMKITNTNPNDLSVAIANRVTRFRFFHQSMTSGGSDIHHNFSYSLFPDTFPGSSTPPPAIVTQPPTMPRLARIDETLEQVADTPTSPPASLEQTILQQTSGLAITTTQFHQTGHSPTQTLFGSQDPKIEFQNFSFRGQQELELIGIDPKQISGYAQVFSALIGVLHRGREESVFRSTLALPVSGSQGAPGQMQQLLASHALALYHTDIMGARGDLETRRDVYNIVRASLPGDNIALDLRMQALTAYQVQNPNKPQILDYPYLLDDADPIEVREAQYRSLFGQPSVGGASPLKTVARKIAEALVWYHRVEDRSDLPIFSDFLKGGDLFDAAFGKTVAHRKLQEVKQLHPHLFGFSTELEQMFNLDPEEYERIVGNSGNIKQMEDRLAKEIEQRLQSRKSHSYKQLEQQLHRSLEEDYLAGLKVLADAGQLGEAAHSHHIFLPAFSFVPDERGGQRVFFHVDNPEHYTHGVILGYDVLKTASMTFRGYVEDVLSVQHQLLIYGQELMPSIMQKIEAGQAITNEEAYALQEYQALVMTSNRSLTHLFERKLAAQALGDKLTASGGVAVAVSSWALDPHQAIFGSRGLRDLHPNASPSIKSQFMSLLKKLDKKKSVTTSEINKTIQPFLSILSADEADVLKEKAYEYVRTKDAKKRKHLERQIRRSLNVLVPDVTEIAAVARSGAPLGAAGEALKANWLEMTGVQDANPELLLSASRSSTLMMLPAASALHTMLGDFDGDTFQFVSTHLGRYSNLLKRNFNEYQKLNRQVEVYEGKLKKVRRDKAKTEANQRRLQFYQAKITELRQQIAEKEQEVAQTREEYINYIARRDELRQEGLEVFKHSVGAMMGFGRSLTDQFNAGEMAQMLTQARSVTDQMQGGREIFERYQRWQPLVDMASTLEQAPELHQSLSEEESAELQALSYYAQSLNKPITGLTQEEIVQYHTTRYYQEQFALDINKNAEKMVGSAIDTESFEALQATIGHLGTQLIGQTYNTVLPMAGRMFALGAMLSLAEASPGFQQILQTRFGENYTLDKLRQQFYSLQGFLQNMQQSIRDSLKAKEAQGLGLLANEQLQSRLRQIESDLQHAPDATTEYEGLSASDVADKRRMEAVRDFIYTQVGAPVSPQDPGSHQLTMFASYLELAELVSNQVNSGNDFYTKFIEKRSFYGGWFGRTDSAKTRMERYQAYRQANPQGSAEDFMYHEIITNLNQARTEFIYQNISGGEGKNLLIDRMENLRGQDQSSLDPLTARMLNAYEQTEGDLDTKTKAAIQASVELTNPLTREMYDTLKQAKQLIQGGRETSDVETVLNPNQPDQARFRQSLVQALRMNKIEGAENQMVVGLNLLDAVGEVYQQVKEANPTLDDEALRDQVSARIMQEDMVAALGMGVTEDEKGAWANLMADLYTRKVEGQDITYAEQAYQQNAILEAQRQFYETQIQMLESGEYSAERITEAEHQLEQQVQQIRAARGEELRRLQPDRDWTSYAANARQELNSLQDRTRENIPSDRSNSILLPDPRLEWVEMAAVPIIVGALTGGVRFDERMAMVGLDMLQSMAQASISNNTLSSEFVRSISAEQQALRAARTAQLFRIRNTIEQNGIIVGALQGMFKEGIYRAANQIAYEAVDALLPKGKAPIPGLKGLGIVASEIVAGMLAMSTTRALSQAAGVEDQFAEYDRTSEILSYIGQSIVESFHDHFDPGSAEEKNFDPVEMEFLSLSSSEELELGMEVLSTEEDVDGDEVLTNEFV